MNQYKKFLGRTDLVKNQVEREKLAEQDAASKRKQRIQEANRRSHLRYQEQLRSELAARYFHSVMSTGGESFSNTKSLTFDGVDDYISLGSRTQNFTDFTVSVWFKTTPKGGINSIIGNSGAEGGYLFFIGQAGGVIKFVDDRKFRRTCSI